MMGLHKIEIAEHAFSQGKTLRFRVGDKVQGVPPLLAAKEGDYLAVLTEAEVAAIESDKLDAARYRALRECHWSESAFVVADVEGVFPGTDCPTGDRLDAVVDAILKGGA